MKENPSSNRVPVIIGIGEYVDRPSDPRQGLEPLELLLRSVRRADEDAGGSWAQRIDSLRVINQISWPYRDLPGQLGKHLRLRSFEGLYGPIGGESPVRMLVDAAMDIASGYSEVALLCGAESLKSAMALRMRGEVPHWSDADPDYKLPNAADFVSKLAARYGLINPVDVYPLYDNAARARWRQSQAEAQQESAAIWESMSKAAAENPYAWIDKPMSAVEIATPSEKNRPIAYPYLKFMVANNGVNQGAAVLLTHLDAARAAGIADRQLIYVGSGAGAHEPYDFLARDRYDHAPAMERTLQRTLELNGLRAADIDLFELYSCFPCVPKLARRSLDLAADAALSVTGGLTFFGGPGNNYMTHAITAMVRALRSGRGAKGLLHGNGEYVTKHHAAVLSTTAPGHAPRNENVQDQVDRHYGAVPALVEDYQGPCRIETYSATFNAAGKPDRGIVIARTPEGGRLLARVSAVETLAFLVDPGNDPVGVQGQAYDAGDGLIHWALQAPVERAQPAVRFEKLTPHIARITLNRPAQRNCVNAAVTRLMVRYVAQVEADPEIRVAILTGSGDRAFCAGADLSEAATRTADLIAGGNGFGGFVNARRSKPWIAAVNGFALGGGTEFTLACDLAVAADNAVFGLPEVQRGLIAGAGGAYRLARSLPSRLAMQYVLTGEQLSAARALELHLVNRVVPAADLQAEALALAEIISNNAPLSVSASRELVAAAYDLSDAELGELSMQMALRLAASEDFREGPRAFMEKRKPVWKGR